MVGTWICSSESNKVTLSRATASRAARVARNCPAEKSKWVTTSAECEGDRLERGETGQNERDDTGLGGEGRAGGLRRDQEDETVRAQERSQGAVAIRMATRREESTGSSSWFRSRCCQLALVK